jgi:hypothetical protein
MPWRPPSTTIAEHGTRPRAAAFLFVASRKLDTYRAKRDFAKTDEPSGSR